MKNASIAALLAAASASAYAAETTLPPVVVTASRTAQTVDETLAPVTVITRDDIERLQPRSVAELLRGLPGITVTNTGGLGKQTSVFLRGTESDHVLVLVDGIKAGSATNGGFAWQDLPPEHIERIEIVRGPRSSLYGSEAIGGVIQIFTRKGGGLTRPMASVGAGSYDTYQGAVSLSGGGDRGWYNISTSYLESDGFSACKEPRSSCSRGFDPDNDGYRRAAVSARGGARFSDGGEIDFYAVHAEGENEYDGSFSNEDEFVQRVVGGQLRVSPTENWRLSLTAGRSWDESDNFLDGAFRSRFNTERDTVSLQNDLTLGEAHLLTLGADYHEDRVDSTVAYDEDARDNVGVFAVYRGDYGAQDLELSIRGDDNQQFGEHATGSIAWGYNVTRSLRFIASYGTAFKAPTFNELYYPGFGNPDLDPERSRTADIGLQGLLPQGRWSAHVFETKVDDLIAFNAATFSPANIDEARIRGLELAAGAGVLDWTVDFAITLLDPENRSDGANRGNLLPRRTERSARLDVGREFGRWRVGGTLLAESERYDDLGNTTRLGGYAVLDLRLGYALAKGLLLEGKLANALDKEYETAAGYNQPDRSVFVSLRYAPGEE